MSTAANLVDRYPGLVDLYIVGRSGIRSFSIGAAVSLDAAYAGTTAMFSVPNGGYFRSKTLRRNRINLVEQSQRGLTRFSYAPVDYASALIPGDPDISFLRVTEVDSSGASLAEGPILVIPPSEFFTSGRNALVLNGTAPNVAGRANNLPPTDAMIIYFSHFADEITIFNDEAGGGDSLFFSFGEGLQELEIEASDSFSFTEAGCASLYLRGGGGTVSFHLVAAIVNGIQG